MPLTVLIMRHRLLSAAAAALVFPWFVIACNGPRAIHERAVMVNGDRVASVDSVVGMARARDLAAHAASRRALDSIANAAAASCTGAVCAGIARGELMLGMTETQVLAATGTLPAAWHGSEARSASSRSPASGVSVKDANGEITSVQLVNGVVSGISRRSRTGVYTEATPGDTTATARSRALADGLIREGDDYIAAGDRVRALERYDRALVMRADDAMLNYKVAQLLDQQLRPVEAVMRYQKFLLQMDLQRIDALGTQNAKLAEAIALAQQRVIVLERSRQPSRNR
ncbi:MAG: hypothetical protein V4617_13070 [Gemmatimonadota bacterium]